MEIGWNWYTILGALVALSILAPLLELVLSLIIGALVFILGGSGLAIAEALKSPKGRAVLFIISGVIIGCVATWLATPSEKTAKTVQVVHPLTGEVKTFRAGTKMKITYKNGSAKVIPIEDIFSYQQHLQQHPESAQEVDRIDLLIPEE